MTSVTPAPCLSASPTAADKTSAQSADFPLK